MKNHANQSDAARVLDPGMAGSDWAHDGSQLNLVNRKIHVRTSDSTATFNFAEIGLDSRPLED